MLKAIIEMPTNTRYKYEIDKKTGILVLDRPVEEMIVANYGYILNTMAEDGDPIDVFVAATEPIPSLTQVTIDVVGMIRCKDNGVQDDKVLAYVKNDLEAKQFMNFNELVGKCSWYLENYKKGLVIEEVLGMEAALEKIEKVKNH